jgi:hypothetical protein
MSRFIFNFFETWKKKKIKWSREKKHFPYISGRSLLIISIPSCMHASLHACGPLSRTVEVLVWKGADEFRGRDHRWICVCWCWVVIMFFDVVNVGRAAMRSPLLLSCARRGRHTRAEICFACRVGVRIKRLFHRRKQVESGGCAAKWMRRHQSHELVSCILSLHNCPAFWVG